MTAADRARTAAKFSAQPVEHAAEQARAARTARVKDVRITFDLPPVRHHALVQRCAEEAQSTGRARITRQDLLSALVALYLTDETTARKVRGLLADEGQT